MTELVRVKQYFAKIREAETKPSTRNHALDKEAAGRFIKHALVSRTIPWYIYGLQQLLTQTSVW